MGPITRRMIFRVSTQVRRVASPGRQSCCKFAFTFIVGHIEFHLEPARLGRSPCPTRCKCQNAIRRHGSRMCPSDSKTGDLEDV